MTHKAQVRLVVLLSLLLTVVQTGFAQAPAAPASPLNFGNNFFVTGDYIVAGAYGMTSNFTTINGVGYAVGTITVPDGNPGISGATQVPTGAQIITALLYWQTVEKVGVVPGGPGSGQNGYFRPLLYSKSGGPAAPGYAISGTNVTGANTVSWSSGGCTGSSTGKLLQTYRTDVSGALPLDANGNPMANGSFEVRLPSVGSSAPLTLGATLVVIYRIPAGAGGPNIPLNSIVIYDGDYSQSNTQLTMTQPLQGFYDADAAPISRLTHIVGNGKSNKYETVYLSSGNNKPTPLPSPYGRMLPPFPGWYGTWDNTTWTFPAGVGNPIIPDASSATTQVVPSMSNQGCVSWGAIIVSTTVHNSHKDGILDSWKTNGGYCDASINNGACSEGNPEDPGWVPLPNPTQDGQDVYLQYDYMCSAINNGSCVSGGGNYSFDPRLATDPNDVSKPDADAIDKVVAAYAKHNITLHAIAGNAILENQTNISCSNSDSVSTCVFPNEPGTVGFREGLTYIKNQMIDPQSGVIGCNTGANPDPNCVVPVFQHGKKDSYHYALFSHGVGLPNWFLFDGSLASVKQSGNTVTFTTKSPHGISQILQSANYANATDTQCTLGRVTVIFAATNSNLNGTFCVLAKPAPTATTFAISVPGSATTFTYTSKTDPNLSLATGQVSSMSGYSDVGGQSSVISLGEGGWGPASNPTSDGNTWQVKAGTFMHELGHTMGLTHGGTFYNSYNPQAKPPSINYTPTFDANCKPNVQSIMSYLFQVDLLQSGETNKLGQPQMVVDYSGQALPTLTKSMPEAAGILDSGGTLPTYPTTSWYQLTSYAVGPALTLSSVAAASGGTTVYTGTITGGAGNAFAGITFTVTGFTPADNGTFTATASTTTTLTLSNAAGVAVPAGSGTATPAGVSQHCDGTPLLGTDQPMTNVGQQPVSSFFWSNMAPNITGLDINFDGNSTDVLHGHDEWDGTAAEGGVGLTPGVDLQQISALGTPTTSGLGGESGLQHPGGGGLQHPGGGGLQHPGGGGLQHPGGGGISDVTHETANSYTRPPGGLTATEASSARTITLNWFQPTFGQIVQYNVYRALGAGAFSLIHSVFPTPPATTFPPTTYTDSPSCNVGGYSYKVTALVMNDVTGQPQESVASNVVSVPDGQDPLTACYVISNFASPATGVQGNLVPISWTLTDDFYSTGGAVINANASSLVVNGPVPGSCSPGTTQVLSAGTVLGSYGTYTQSANQFTFTLNTDLFCAGSYTFALTLDSTQTQTTTVPLVLGIDINDYDNPRITTEALPGGTVGLAYPTPANPTYTLGEEGGTGPFTWGVTGLQPTGGISQQGISPTLSGTPCFAGNYAVSASVTDAKGNKGMQPFTLPINQGTSTTTVTGSNANPSVFQQTLTFMVTVASQPASTCMPTGTVNLFDGLIQIGTAVLSNGSATITIIPNLIYNPSVGGHSITASYLGDSNFTGSTSLAYVQTVNKANTTISNILVSPSPAFVGQTISVSYTVSVQAPGGVSPVPPTGTVSISPASDGSMCSVPLLTICSLSPPPSVPETVTFPINYSGDANFAGSPNNSGYTVNQLIFTAEPTNTGAGLTINAGAIPPGVQVTAEDPSGNPLMGFTGPITVAIASGPGTLSGTIPRNAVAGVATFPDLSINQVASGYTLKASPDGVVFDSTSTAFNIDTFYVDGSGNFGLLDLPTGTTTQIASLIGAGNPLVLGPTGLDLTSTDQVFELNLSGQLMQVTPSTGATTAVGMGATLPNPGYTTTGGTANGSYYGIDALTGILYLINTSTGVATQVGANPMAVALVPPGCSFETSVTGSGSVIYYTVGIFIPAQNPAPNQPFCTLPANMNDTLYQINPADGTSLASPVQLSGNGFAGSAFVGGKLYGFTYSPSQEYTINTTSGAATPGPTTTVPIVGAGSSQ